MAHRRVVKRDSADNHGEAVAERIGNQDPRIPSFRPGF